MIDKILFHFYTRRNEKKTLENVFKEMFILELNIQLPFKYFEFIINLKLHSTLMNSSGSSTEARRPELELSTHLCREHKPNTEHKNGDELMSWSPSVSAPLIYS